MLNTPWWLSFFSNNWIVIHDGITIKLMKIVTKNHRKFVIEIEVKNGMLNSYTDGGYELFRFYLYSWISPVFLYVLSYMLENLRSHLFYHSVGRISLWHAPAIASSTTLILMIWFDLIKRNTRYAIFNLAHFCDILIYEFFIAAHLISPNFQMTFQLNFSIYQLINFAHIDSILLWDY